MTTTAEELRVIRSEDQYEQYLEEAERLAVSDPVPGSREAERFELLALLIEAYERERFPKLPTSPIEAIKFRMEEQGLQQRDLVPFLGSKSRASEVLSGKRGLTVEMIKSLSSGLGIPPAVLLSDTREEVEEERGVELDELPYADMIRRGWIKPSRRGKEASRDAVKVFLAQVGIKSPGTFFLRRTINCGSKRPANKAAIYAWLVRVLVLARKQKQSLLPFDPAKISAQVLRDVAQLSWSETGPVLAREYLSKLGIACVIEPHLPHTRLDGAAMLDEDGTPVIGLTIRFDRLDNFWFTLLHELVHIYKHLRDSKQAFVDDTETVEDEDPKEVEANRIGGEAFIPRNLWIQSEAYRRRTDVSAIREFAYRLRIHPAIVAGRIRRDTGNYRILSRLLGSGEVRRLFPELTWPTR
ncbi:MAG TPA: ImmA/IrrE family metallo-endopeptidase [Burkholderiales bacterium]|nr:ImmA/IrrE family metallo-endopeptidase [Burkholderiales bacterium]